MNRKIVFFGALPPKDESKVGGGEWGNLRTVKMLRLFGYDVITIRKSNVKTTRSRLFRIATSPFRTFGDILKVVFCLIQNKNVVFHFSGFAWKTIYMEYLIIRVAKMVGCRLIYEIRGGGLLASYANGGNRYNHSLKYILSHSDYIFTQGKENIPLLESLCDVPVYHYANCVSEDFYPSTRPVKAHDTIGLLYFGRINPDKNLSLIVETARILQQSRKNVMLTIIGSGQDQTYIKRIHDKARRELEQNSYEFIPGCTHDKLKNLLQDKHFYLFPSQVVLEGQSNSVTEAMSYGIVPIASPQGFNRSTIGNDNLIVEKYAAEEYAKRINEIIDNNELDYYSEFVYRRFLDNYTESVVFEKTRIVYDEIYGNYAETTDLG